MGGIFRYGGTPLSGSVPADWPDKIMHGSITIGRADAAGRRRVTGHSTSLREGFH
jgi:hypothetical protein